MKKNFSQRALLILVLFALVFGSIFTDQVKAKSINADEVDSSEKATIEPVLSSTVGSDGIDSDHVDTVLETYETILNNPIQDPNEITPTEIPNETGVVEPTTEDSEKLSEIVTDEETEPVEEIEPTEELTDPAKEASDLAATNPLQPASPGTESELPIEISGYSGRTGAPQPKAQVARYIKAGSNIRSAPGGTVIEKIKMPIYATGTFVGDYFKFTYSGRIAYAHKSILTTNSQPIAGYTKSKANVRSAPNGNIIGSLSIGQKVSGTLVGNWVKFNYSGRTGYVYASLLQANPVRSTRYVKAGSNIRSTPGGAIIEKIKMPIYVTGTIQGNYLRFIHKNKTAYAHMIVTTTKSPSITGYTKSPVNVRSTPNGSVIGLLSQGCQVSGILVGNWVKFTYLSRTAYMYASLLNATRPSAPKYQTDGIWRADSWYTGDPGTSQYFRKFLSGSEVYYLTIGSGTMTAYYTLEDARAGKDAFAQYNYTQTGTSSFQYIGNTNSSSPPTYTVKGYLISNDWLEVVYYRKTFNYQRVE